MQVISELQSTDSTNNEFNKAWKLAKDYVFVLGHIPATFTVPIRILLHEDKTGQSLSPAAHFLVMRLLTSPTLKAVLYYSALTFHGAELSKNSFLSSSDLVRLYKPRELAAVLGLTYIYRKLVRLNARSLYLWKDVESDLIFRSELAGYLGHAIPNIGRYKCIWATNAHHIGITIFGLNDPEAYKEYRRYLLSNKIRYDYDYEKEAFGCTHLDVTCNILQQFGFGVATAHALMVGMLSLLPDDHNLAREAYEYALAKEWSDSLILNEKEPDTTHLGEYYPLEKDKLKLLEEVKELMTSGSKYNWLTRSKADINFENTPQLYQEILMHTKQSKSLQDFYKNNLPKEVLNKISSEELTEISKVKTNIIK
jgi:hypothetical protein